VDIQTLTDYKFKKYLDIGFEDIDVFKYFDYLAVRQEIGKLNYKDIKRLNKILNISYKNKIKE